MPYVAVDICNRAIAKVGGEPIEALDEDSPLGAFCADNYASTRDLLLSKHRWVFASRVVQLARLSTPPAGNPRAYLFERPSDLVGAIHDFRAGAAQDAAKVSTLQTADGVAADVTTVWAEYTGQVAEAAWPPWFRNLVETAFAAEVAAFAQMRSRGDALKVEAFGLPEMQGEGGLYLTARQEDGRNAPQRALTYADGGALVAARYGCGLPSGFTVIIQN